MRHLSYTKNIASLLAILLVPAFPSAAQDDTRARFMTIYENNGQEETTSSDGISFVRNEYNDSYAWQPLNWQQSDLSSYWSVFDIKNVKSIFRYVQINNQFKVTLPEEAPISEEDFVAKAYGKEISPSDDYMYTTNATAVSIVNKDGRTIYDCYVSFDTLEIARDFELNALETAYTLLIPAFPGIFDTNSDDVLSTLKSLLAELPETHELASAIDRSIVRNGYLEMEDIDSEYQNAIDCIMEKTGLKNNYLKSGSASAVSRTPLRRPAVVNGDGIYGYKLVMNNSKWFDNSIGKGWSCDFTAYNSGRFAYTAWVKGFLGEDGYIHLYDFDESYLRSQILKPQRVTTFMGTFTDPVTKPFKADSWEGISNYWSDTYRLFFEDGFGFEDMTWDCTKKSFGLTFFSKNDYVVALAPADNDFMLYYNIMKSIIDPALKEVGKKLTEDDKDDYLIQLCVSLVADDDFRYKFSEIFYNNEYSLGTKAKDILKIVWPKAKKSLDSFFKEQVKTKSYQYVWDHWGFTAAGELQNAVDDIEKNWNKWLKIVEKVGDITLGVVGLVEPTYCYDIDLDFEDYDVSGYDIPQDGLVAFYPFSGNANDVSGHGNNGILSGDNLPELTTDRFGKKNHAYYFGGYDNHNWIRVPNSESLIFSKEMTISFWIEQSEMIGMNGWMRRTSDDPAFAAICKAGDGNATYPGLYITTSKGTDGKGLHVSTNNSNGNAHSQSYWNHNINADKPDYQLGDWLHIALVVNDTEKILYLDGIEAGRDDLGRAADFTKMNSQDLYIGIMAGGNNMNYSMSFGAWYPFLGKIDDLAIYNRALNQSEIVTLLRVQDLNGGGGGGSSDW